MAGFSRSPGVRPSTALWLTELLLQPASHERNTRSGNLFSECRGRQRARLVHDSLTLALEPATHDEDGGVRACPPLLDLLERGSGRHATGFRDPRQLDHIGRHRPGLDGQSICLGAERHLIGEEQPQSLLLPGDAAGRVGHEDARAANSSFCRRLRILTRPPRSLERLQRALGLDDLSPGHGFTSLRVGHRMFGLPDLPRQPRNRESNALGPGPHVVDPAEQRTHLLNPHSDISVTLLELPRVGDELA